MTTAESRTHFGLPVPATPAQSLRCPTTGKVSYQSKDVASAILKDILVNHPISPRLNVYQCWACQNWHLGRSSKNLSDKRQRGRLK